MTLDEVKAWLTENKDDEGVSAYLQGLAKVDTARMDEFLTTDGGLKYLQPKLDTYSTTALNSWKKNHLAEEIKGAVEEELKERLPEPESAQDKRIRDLEQTVKAGEAKILATEQREAGVSYGNTKGIPTDLSEHFLVQKEGETMQARMDELDRLLKQRDEKVMQQFLRDNGREPTRNRSADPKVNPFDPKINDIDAQSQLFVENPGRARELAAAVGKKI